MICPIFFKPINYVSILVACALRRANTLQPRFRLLARSQTSRSILRQSGQNASTIDLALDGTLGILVEEDYSSFEKGRILSLKGFKYLKTVHPHPNFLAALD